MKQDLSSCSPTSITPGGRDESVLSGGSSKEFTSNRKGVEQVRTVSPVLTPIDLATHSLSAVLIYDHRESGPVENPLKRAVAPRDDVVVNLKGSRKPATPDFDFVAHLTHATGLPKGTDITRQYRLVFVLQNMGTYRVAGWAIYPAVQYVRKDGARGRIEKYRADRITEPFGKPEKKLLYRLRVEEDHRDALRNHIDFLIKNPPPFLFVQDKYSYVPVSFVEIDTIRVDFSVSMLRDQSPSFVPEIH